mmetsp:Transcript_11509/g.42091  ORF Transcript_11509/g.42091 Transcript_11509/m.42091 type:complete len:316 (-) Transcript_11509:1952-2899(-)
MPPPRELALSSVILPGLLGSVAPRHPVVVPVRNAILVSLRLVENARARVHDQLQPLQHGRVSHSQQCAERKGRDLPLRDSSHRIHLIQKHVKEHVQRSLRGSIALFANGGRAYELLKVTSILDDDAGEERRHTRTHEVGLPSVQQQESLLQHRLEQRGGLMREALHQRVQHGNHQQCTLLLHIPQRRAQDLCRHVPVGLKEGSAAEQDVAFQESHHHLHVLQRLLHQLQQERKQLQQLRHHLRRVLHHGMPQLQAVFQQIERLGPRWLGRVPNDREDEGVDARTLRAQGEHQPLACDQHLNAQQRLPLSAFPDVR